VTGQHFGLPRQPLLLGCIHCGAHALILWFPWQPLSWVCVFTAGFRLQLNGLSSAEHITEDSTTQWLYSMDEILAYKHRDK